MTITSPSASVVVHNINSNNQTISKMSAHSDDKFITKTCPYDIQYFFRSKIDNFQRKIFDIFLIFAENIDCGYTLEKGTSRQRSGKGAIRKRLPLQKPRWEKTKLTIRYLYHETYRKPNEQLFSQ